MMTLAAIYQAVSQDVLFILVEKDSKKAALETLHITTQNFLLNLRSLLYTYHKHECGNTSFKLS